METRERVMKPFHSANLIHQPYPSWRVILLAYVGRALGIQFHICGIPLGSQRSAYRLRDEVARIGDGLNDAF
jgi:hypothetical protein